jgi:DNA-binding MarR family transcriptional regulator
VALTAAGRKAFEKVAQVHEGWVVELLGGLAPGQKHELHELLGRLRVHLAQSSQENNG